MEHTSISRTRKSTVGRLVADADETCNPWSSKAPRIPAPPFTSWCSRLLLRSIQTVGSSAT